MKLYIDSIIEYINDYCTKQESLGLLKVVFTTNSSNRLSIVIGAGGIVELLETIERMNITYPLMGLTEHIRLLDMESPGHWDTFKSILIDSIADCMRQYDKKVLKSDMPALRKKAAGVLDTAPVLYGIALLELVNAKHFPAMEVTKDG